MMSACNKSFNNEVNTLRDKVDVDIVFARSLKLMMMLLLRLGQTSYHSDGEPRWEREGGRKRGDKRRLRRLKEKKRERGDVRFEICQHVPL